MNRNDTEVIARQLETPFTKSEMSLLELSRGGFKRVDRQIHYLTDTVETSLANLCLHVLPD